MQRILLSATIPPSSTRGMARCYGLFIRQNEIKESTYQYNLSYRVIEQDQAQFKTAEEAVVRRTAEAFVSELRSMAQVTRKCAVQSDSEARERKFSKQEVILYVPFSNMVSPLCEAIQTAVFESLGRRAEHFLWQTRRNPKFTKVSLESCPYVIVFMRTSFERSMVWASCNSC